MRVLTGPRRGQSICRTDPTLQWVRVYLTDAEETDIEAAVGAVEGRDDFSSLAAAKAFLKPFRRARPA